MDIKLEENKNIGWKVSLNDGSTHYEGKGNYLHLDGELSPWQRLVAHLEANNLHITSLGLYTSDGRTFNLPSAGNNPVFHAFSKSDKPLKYLCYRKVGLDVLGKNKSSNFIVAEAQYATHSLQVWVDCLNTRNSWVLAIPHGADK